MWARLIQGERFFCFHCKIHALIIGSFNSEKEDFTRSSSRHREQRNTIWQPRSIEMWKGTRASSAMRLLTGTTFADTGTIAGDVTLRRTSDLSLASTAIDVCQTR